jgi:hypothetical protein
MPEEESKNQEPESSESPASAAATEDSAELERMASAFGIKHKEEPPKEPEKEPEPKKEAHEPEETEPETGTVEQKMRSWTGRKMAEQTKNLEEMVRRVMAETLSSFLPPPEKESGGEQPPAAKVDVDFNPDDLVTTKGEVMEILEKAFAPTLARVRQGESEQAKQFSNNYVTTLAGLYNSDKLDPDMRKEVAKELDEGIKNPVVHNDPKVCAQLNYRAALTNVLRKKLSTPATEPVIPVKGKPANGAGMTAGSKTDIVAPITLALDAEAKRLQKAFGLSDDWVQKRLAKK